MEQQFSTFYLDNEFLGVPVESVQEVLTVQDMTPVPLAPESVTGLINLRGQIVMAVDLRRRLEMPVRAQDEAPVNVVIRTDEGPVSLLVDRIGDVLSADETLFEQPPETMRGTARELILGAYKLKGRLLLILDIVRTLQLRHGKMEQTGTV